MLNQIATGLKGCTDSDIRSKVVPVLFGGDILTYTWARSFNDEWGLTSIVYATADIKYLSSSRFCDLHVVPGVDAEDVCLAELRKLGPKLAEQGKVGVILGTGDWYARSFSIHKEELEQWYVVPYIDFDLLDRLTQKTYFYNLCAELGIDYPKTITLDCSRKDSEPPIEAAADFKYPLIAKPSNSARWHYAEFEGKRKIHVVETPSELEDLCRKVLASSYDKDLLIQEFIPGGDDCLWSITCFSDAAGDVRAWATGRVLREDHHPSAIGNPICIHVQPNPQIAAQAARLIKHEGYRGFSNFDVKRDPRDGSFRFFEVNTRAGRNSYYMTLGGVNIVRLIVDEYIKQVPIAEQVADEAAIFSVIPRKVMCDLVQDEQACAEAVKLWDAGKWGNPLFNKNDSFTHNFWARLAYLNWFRKAKNQK